jgi:hypothetical protein
MKPARVNPPATAARRPTSRPVKGSELPPLLAAVGALAAGAGALVAVLCGEPPPGVPEEPAESVCRVELYCAAVGSDATAAAGAAIAATAANAIAVAASRRSGDLPRVRFDVEISITLIPGLVRIGPAPGFLADKTRAVTGDYLDAG